MLGWDIKETAADRCPQGKKEAREVEAFRQNLTQNSYCRDMEVDFSHCDRSQRMRVGAMLTQAAVYAGYDYDARGLTYEVLYEKREVFLLSRMALRIHRCPRVRDVLTITTWENGARGAHMQRCYEFRNRLDGTLCLSVRSDWILVDPVSRKILRPSQFTARPITACPVEIDCPEPKKIAVPAEAESLGERVVRWSDLDGNGHLFSGNYGDIVWDALPADLQAGCPTEFFINYSREATLGETLRLTGHREGTAYRMEGAGPDGPCFTALAVF